MVCDDVNKRMEILLSVKKRNSNYSNYTKGPAAFGSVKNLTNASQLSPKKVKKFLRSQSSHTKYGLFRKTYPRLKVIVNDINEIWSLDLAYVDKLAKYNRGYDIC